MPKASLPASARARAPGTLSRIQRILLAGKVGVDDQAGLGPDRVAGAVRLQALAEVRGAAILPDDRVVDRLAGLAVPDDGRLALVGDADARPCRPGARARGRALRPPRRSATPRSRCGSCSTQPARRKDLGELLLRDGADRAALVEHDRAGAGGALIEREDVRHGRCSVRLAGQSLYNAPMPKGLRAKCWPSSSARSS